MTMETKKVARQNRIHNELDDGAVLQVIKRARRISSKSQFEHTPLASPESEIRLFEFQPTTTHDAFRLSLRTWNLNKCTNYSAISYVWGNPTKCRTIEVNGKTLGTTSNAFYALQQVLYQYRDGNLRTEHFWMDSLCIDQENLEEKGVQVELMGSIYEDAEEALSCVGAHAGGSKLVIDVFREVSVADFLDGIRKEREQSGTRLKQRDVLRRMAETFTTVLQHKGNGRQSETDPSLDVHSNFCGAVVRFCNREYWRRIWIVQEIRLAKDVKLFCGSDLLDISRIAPFCDYSAAVTFEAALKWLQHWAKSSMAAVLSASRHTQGSEKSKPYLAQLAFRDLYESQCADFRDRVYGLLRVMRWNEDTNNITFRPDYQITKIGLMVQVLEDMVSMNCSGVTSWATMGSLYDALRLTADHAEVSRMLEERRIKSGSDANALTSTVSSQECGRALWMRRAFQLNACADGLAVTCSCTPFRPSRIPSSALEVKERQHLPLKVDAKPVGWICPQARPGDYLLPEAMNVEDPLGAPDLVVRPEGNDSGRFKIIGHAILYHRLESLTTPVVRLELLIDIEDFIALIALRKNALQEGFDADDLVELLTMSPTSAEFSSYAVRRRTEQDGGGWVSSGIQGGNGGVPDEIIVAL